MVQSLQRIVYGHGSSCVKHKVMLVTPINVLSAIGSIILPSNDL